MFSQSHLSSRHYARQSDASEVSSIPSIPSRPSPANPASPARPTTTSSAVSDAVSSFSELSFNPFNLSRTSSIYTLGRTSFAAQLNQLVCVDLPDPKSLQASVSAIPTASEACRVLSGAAPPIKRWIDTAAQILSGLDTEDDIELVSSADESVQEVDMAVSKFAELINIYIGAIDGLQKRDDVSSVPSGQVKGVVKALEDTLRPWEQVKKSLADAKSHVNLAKEWEELWNSYMGEIRNELSDLERLIFQLEERRHLSMAEKSHDDAPLFEMDDSLAPIAEDHSTGRISRDHSPSGALPGFTITSPLATASAANASEDSGLLALFARMQPVQASLSFLPIRLASFKSRAQVLFPTACQELDERREGLEAQWQKLEKNAETLRDELSEDRWIDVFRNAGRQATKMCQSVDRGIKKLNEAILTTSNQGTPASTLAKKINDYENKRESFGPAIEKILAVIDKGVADRKTVNGEVLKIQAETRRVWEALEAEMADMDATLKNLPDVRSRVNREGGGISLMTDVDATGPTPGSSPESPLDVRGGAIPVTPDVGGGGGISSIASLRSTPSSVPGAGRRPGGLPISAKYLSPRSVSGSSTASTPRTSFSSATPMATSRLGSSRRGGTPSSDPAANRPRWTGSTVVDYKSYGPHKRPESRMLRAPSSAASSVYSYSSSMPQSPLSRGHAASPSPASRRLSISPGRTATPNGTLEARPRQYKPSHLVQEKLGMVHREESKAASGRASATGSRAGSRLGYSSLPIKRSAKESDRPKWRP